MGMMWHGMCDRRGKKQGLLFENKKGGGTLARVKMHRFLSKRDMINGELIVDNFAGGGGASTGIELATGKSVDIAINHDPEAIRMHKANHPNTKHYCEDVWQVDPIKAGKGHPV